MDIFLPNFLKKAVVTILKQLLGKHSCESVISTFLKSRFLLIRFFGGNFSFIFGGFSWYSFVVMMISIRFVIDLFY